MPIWTHKMKVICLIWESYWTVWAHWYKEQMLSPFLHFLLWNLTSWKQPAYRLWLDILMSHPAIMYTVTPEWCSLQLRRVHGLFQRGFVCWEMRWRSVFKEEKAKEQGVTLHLYLSSKPKLRQTGATVPCMRSRCPFVAPCYPCNLEGT